MMKDWEVIATNLSRERWDWDCIVSMDSEKRDIFVGQAHRDGKRIVVRADEIWTVFLELEAAVCKPQGKRKSKTQKSDSYKESARFGVVLSAKRKA